MGTMILVKKPTVVININLVPSGFNRSVLKSNVGPFSRNVVATASLFSSNVGPKQRMFLGQAIYVLRPLRIVDLKQIKQVYRPIIAVHKWFARRPGALFRARHGASRAPARNSLCAGRPPIHVPLGSTGKKQPYTIDIKIQSCHDQESS